MTAPAPAARVDWLLDRMAECSCGERVREYEAIGESAYVADLARRPGMVEALRDAEAGQYDILIMHESSRLARNERAAHEILDRLTSAHVQLVNASSEIDYSTPEGRMMYGIEANLNAYWSRKLSQHIKKSKAQMFADGLHVGYAPFGYRRAGRGEPIEVVPEEAAEVRRAYEDRLAGVSEGAIASRLNTAGYRTRRGGLFAHHSIQTIVENPLYAGYIVHHGERRRGRHEAIVSEALWQEVQALRRTRVRSPRAAEVRGMLAGLAVCADCGSRLWQRRSAWGGYETFYYRDPPSYTDPPCLGVAHGWRIEQVDDIARQVIVGMALDERWLAEVDREARREPAGDAHATRRRQLEATRTRVTNAYLAGALAPDAAANEAEWRARLTAVDVELASLPSPIPTGLLFGASRLRSVGELWESPDGFTPAERRDTARLLFKRVEIDLIHRQLWFEPWDELDPLFGARRRHMFATAGLPGQSRGSNPRPWLYMPHELVELSA